MPHTCCHNAPQLFVKPHLEGKLFSSPLPPPPPPRPPARPIYYRDADAALLVFDITDVDSFTRVKNWVKELKKMAGKDIVLVLAGNKVDMERNRQVTNEDAEAYAASAGLCKLRIQLARSSKAPGFNP
jgi:GTPase SAR1 family protein